MGLFVYSNMSGTKVPYVQDLPPKGGYPSIRYARHLPVRGYNGWIMLGFTATAMALGLWQVRRGNNELRILSKEKYDARACVMPIYQAELDRGILLKLKVVEEEEAFIMKDVPGWIPGENVYHSQRWFPPHPAQLKRH